MHRFFDLNRASEPGQGFVRPVPPGIETQAPKAAAILKPLRRQAFLQTLDFAWWVILPEPDVEPDSPGTC